MKSKHITQIKYLKEKLENRKMSVMVGAGFSKNISKTFPSWSELLYDAAYFLEGKEIERSYMNSASNRLEKKDAYIKKEITAYINKIGYLELVSEYIKRKGYREAITTYIEDRTPSIIEKNNRKYLYTKLGKIKEEEIKGGMLSQHRLLLRLGWNNIYTTNYDEMLELANDTTSEETIKAEIKILDEEINILLNTESKLLTEIEVEKDDQKKQQLTRQLEYNDNTIKQKERDLIKFNGSLSECITVVTHSTHLSLKRNKNIIKLHGTLRKNKNLFGFDGDIHKTYVIAKEDYATYPDKHEAFTQLMRISLLQESYCLIGFSGVDPNFIEWVKWVRDILEKDRNNIASNEYKIYFIDVSNETPEDDKLLFFENYRICRIPLLNDDMLKFLQSQTERIINDPTDRKEVVELFLHFLADGKSYSVPKTSVEKINRNKYKNIWQSLSIYKAQDADLNETHTKTNQLISIKQYNRIPSNASRNSQNKYTLLQYSEVLLRRTDGNPMHKNSLMNLIILAMKDTFWPIHFVFKATEIQAIYDDPEIEQTVKNNIRHLELRQSVLEWDKKRYTAINKLIDINEDNVIYHSILMSVFYFDFKTVINQLDAWKPDSHWLLKKIGLLALFDIVEAEKQIETYILSIEKEHVQEQLYFFLLLRFIKQSRSFQIKKSVYDRINNLENLGFKSITENLDNIITDITPKPEKLDRYGAQRFSISNNITFSGDPSNQSKGIEFIQVLIDSGFPLKLGYTYLESSEKWYLIFKTVYQYLPYPSLFYSLQYTDEKFLGRIGQDFINSPHLIAETNDILPKLLKTYLDNETLYSFRKSILYFCSELLIAVNVKLWEGLFFQIWKKEKFQRLAFDDRRNEAYTFVKAALPYIENISILRNVVYESVKEYEKSTAVDFLYYLHKNKNCYKDTKFQTKIIRRSIDSTIGKFSTNSNVGYVIGNLYSILTDLQKQKIVDALHLINYKDAPENYSWKTIVFLTKDYPKMAKKLKKGILKNKNLWNAGFTDEGVSSGIHHINLDEIRYRESYPKGLIWTARECKVIFEKLIVELEKIEKFRLRYPERDGFITFSSVLEEMQLFLNGEKNKLELLSNYSTVSDLVNSLIVENKGYSSILEGIISDHKSEVILALNDLFYILEEDIADTKIDEYLTVLLNKILLQCGPALEASINYISGWIRDDKNKVLFEPHLKLIVAILQRYDKHELVGSDRPFVQEKLIDMTTVLIKWGINDPIVDKWQTIKLEERYLSLNNEV